MTRYKQTFWSLSIRGGDIGSKARAQIAKAALEINQGSGVLLCSFAGGYNWSEEPELSLTLPDGVNAGGYKSTIERALANEGLVTTVTLKSKIVYHDFDTRNLQNISEATSMPDKEAVRQSIDKISQQPVAAAQTSYVTPTGREAFSISQLTYQRMCSAWGSDIKKEFSYLQQTLDKLSKEKNTNVSVLHMLAGGVVTLGVTMWKMYAAYAAAGGLVPLIAGAIASLGGIVRVVRDSIHG